MIDLVISDALRIAKRGGYRDGEKTPYITMARIVTEAYNAGYNKAVENMTFTCGINALDKQ